MFSKNEFECFVRFRSQINNLENSDVFRFNFQIEFQKFSKFDTVEHMKSEYHVTYIRKNWNFWSKNKYFSMKSRFLIDKWRFLSRIYQFLYKKWGIFTVLVFIHVADSSVLYLFQCSHVYIQSQAQSDIFSIWSLHVFNYKKCLF